MLNKCSRECWAPMKTHEHRDQRPGVTSKTARMQSVTRFCFLAEKSTAYAKTILSDARFFAPAVA
jgi:hypothetical protein